MIDDELDVNFIIKATLDETGLFQVDTFNDTKLAHLYSDQTSMVLRF
jgi:hypothetical protein